MEIPERYESILRTALEVAAERFTENARLCMVWGAPEGQRRVGEQFQRQAAECRQMIDILDGGSACDDGRPHDWDEPADERRPTVCRRCNAQQGD
jgi:hypothetical protein